jgi:hypothetical protein
MDEILPTVKPSTALFLAPWPDWVLGIPSRHAHVAKLRNLPSGTPLGSSGGSVRPRHAFRLMRSGLRNSPAYNSTVLLSTYSVLFQLKCSALIPAKVGELTFWGQSSPKAAVQVPDPS